MQQAAAKIHAEESIAEIEKQIIPVTEIFVYKTRPIFNPPKKSTC
jgi:hypothetical protein